MTVKLPKEHLPDNLPEYKECEPGIDLSLTFIDALRQIDDGLYPIWHQYKIYYDNIMNAYHGPLDDPREKINYNYGQLNMGFVLTGRKGEPLLEETQLEKENPKGHKGAWHIWRHSSQFGWYHVIKLESTEAEYLQLVIKRLWKYHQFTEKYGFLQYNKAMADLDEETKQKIAKEYTEVLEAEQDANMWLMRRVMDNFSRGEVAATNPTKEQIISYPGQSNRSRIIRPLDDDDQESGIILASG